MRELEQLGIIEKKKKDSLFFDFLFWSRIRIRRNEEEVNIHREHTEDTPQTKHRGERQNWRFFSQTALLSR
jgi:hypothetical protein